MSKIKHKFWKSVVLFAVLAYLFDYPNASYGDLSNVTQWVLLYTTIGYTATWLVRKVRNKKEDDNAGRRTV